MSTPRKLGVFRLDRPLYSPVHYPGDYGFVPGTLAPDGDVRPIGVMNMVDQGESDQKILAVPNRSPRYDGVDSLDRIYPHVRREIEHFFNIYKELEGRKTATFGWIDADAARRVIEEGRKKYLAGHAALKD